MLPSTFQRSQAEWKPPVTLQRQRRDVRRRFSAHLPEVEAAIDILMERQRTVVQWWDDNVSRHHGGDHKSSMRGPAYLKQAEEATGLGQPQVSRFRTALKDPDAYRARLIARVHRAVRPIHQLTVYRPGKPARPRSWN